MRLWNEADIPSRLFWSMGRVEWFPSEVSSGNLGSLVSFLASVLGKAYPVSKIDEPEEIKPVRTRRRVRVGLERSPSNKLEQVFLREL